MGWSDGSNGGLQDHRMPSQSEGFTPPVVGKPLPSVLSTTSPTNLHPPYLLKLQNFPSRLVQTLFAKFRSLGLPLRQIRPAATTSATRLTRRHPVFARNGVFVSPGREAPSDATAGATTDRRRCDEFRSSMSSYAEVMHNKFVFFVSFVLFVGFVVSYIRWMLWKDREYKLGDKLHQISDIERS